MSDCYPVIEIFRQRLKKYSIYNSTNSTRTRKVLMLLFGYVLANLNVEGQKSQIDRARSTEFLYFYQKFLVHWRWFFSHLEIIKQLDTAKWLWVHGNLTTNRTPTKSNSYTYTHKKTSLITLSTFQRHQKQIK